VADVTLQKVTKNFSAGVAAVKELTLSVAHGEFVVLLGPSGCGKTTTLRLIAGLEQPDAGEVLIDGKLVNHLPPQKRDLALVFQSYALYPHMTVAQNMGFNLKMRRLPSYEISRRVRETSVLLGLDALLDRYPNQLSGGQRQRVALGRAIIRNPVAFLLDEPLSNLDAQLRAETRIELLNLQRRLAGTFIFVTHDQTEAMMLADVLVVMRNGKIEQIGPPEEIYRKPANTFVARFLGSPMMNTLEGRIVKDNGGAFFHNETFMLQLPKTLRNIDAIDSDTKIVLGFRPEDAEISPRGSITMKVELVETLGSQKFILGFARQGQQLMVSIDPKIKPQVGEVISISVPPESIHLFYSSSGLRIDR